MDCVGLFHHVLIHWRSSFGPSCTEFAYTVYWNFENGATSTIDHVLLEHYRLSDVPPLAVHLKGQG